MATASRRSSQGKQLPRSNGFMCFLQKYRDQCPAGQTQRQLAKEAGDIWRKMTDEQKCPFVHEANAKKGRVGE